MFMVFIFFYITNLSELAAVWKIYFNDINELQLNNNTAAVNSMLNSMATSPVVTACKFNNKIKLDLYLEIKKV
jgi:hypothetical protein